MKKKNTKQINELKNKAITILLMLEQVILDEEQDNSFREFAIQSLIRLSIETANEIVRLEIQDDEN